MVAPPAETMASTPKEVATIAFIGKSVKFFKEGTMMNPPPTPNSPDRKPAVAPANIKALAQGTVHINFPIDISSWQGGGFIIGGVVPANV